MLQPFVVVRLPNGDIKSSEYLDNGNDKTDDVQLEYKWIRCKWKHQCSIDDCRKPATIQFAPVLKCLKHACTRTLQVPVDPGDLVSNASFCSVEHLVFRWKKLRQLQAMYSGIGISSDYDERKQWVRSPLPILDSEKDLALFLQIDKNGYSILSSEENPGQPQSQSQPQQQQQQQPQQQGVPPPQIPSSPPSISLASSPESPSNLNSQAMPRDLALLKTALEGNSREKQVVATSRDYTPTQLDVNSILQLWVRCVSSKYGSGKWTMSESDSVRSIPVEPPPRNLINLQNASVEPIGPRSRTASRVANGKTDSIRVLSYNCLAEIYASSRQFEYCSPWAVAWPYRQRNLLRELERYDADVLCLQEIQADHYEQFLEPQMKALGYAGIYQQKSRESMGKVGKIDGCATFYRESLLEVVQKQSVEYDGVAQRTIASLSMDSRALNRLIRGNVGLIVVFRWKEKPTDYVCVANTHIYWDPEKSDVKLFQVYALLHHLETLALTCPLIVAGDFNSEPDSAVYELLSTGMVSPNHKDLQQDPVNVLSRLQLGTSLNLSSSYAILGREPEFTNYTLGYVGTLDYIWYSPDSLRVVSLLQMPDEAALFNVNGKMQQHKSIPNELWSSDHCALLCDFRVLR